VSTPPFLRHINLSPNPHSKLWRKTRFSDAKLAFAARALPSRMARLRHSMKHNPRPAGRGADRMPVAGRTAVVTSGIQPRTGREGIMTTATCTGCQRDWHPEEGTAQLVF